MSNQKKCPDVLSPEWDRRMALQKEEFDAADKLAVQIRRHSLTSPVDDDYPEIRHCYESALAFFLHALRENGRLQQPPQSGDFMRRLHEANASRGQRWHPSGLVSWSLSDWFTALAGEIGELGAATINMTQAVYSAYADLSSRGALMGNIIKKLNRDRDGLIGNRETVEQLRAMMAQEAADILIYLELFAQVAGFDLVEATRQKFNEVSERNGFPERL